MRIEIGTSIDAGRTIDLLGSDVVHRADNVTLAAGDRLVFRQLLANGQCESHVEDFRVAVRRDHYVRRLQVAMDEALAVSALQAVGYFGEQAGGAKR